MSNQHYRAKPRQARKFVIDCIRAGLVPYLQSSPGMGKSAIVKSIVKDMKLELIDHRLSTSEPTDMTGLPEFMDVAGVDGNTYRMARFAPFADLFPISGISKIPDGKGGWIVFFDEFSSATRATQAASYKVTLDRMVGQYRLHENAAVVAAGNLTTDRAIVNPLSTALQSRLIHIEMEIDFEQWLEDVAFKENYDPRIIGFLSQYPGKLMDFKPDHHDKTFCCPRTWEFADRLLKVQQTQEVSDDLALLLTGTISSGVAVEFVQFTKVYQNLITLSEIRKDPENCRVPHETSLKWATITHMVEKITDENFKDLATYANRFDLSFKILFFRYALNRKKNLREHPEFGRYASIIANA